jgi:ATP-dependent Lon protease
VLVDIERVRRRTKDLQAGAQGDSDHAKREQSVLKRALQLGPDRAVGLVPWWGEALYELAEEMPAFRRAIEIMRHMCAVIDATERPTACPPILLVGPPGTGKSYVCRRLAECLELTCAWLAFDQPSAGSQLCGSDRVWSTSAHGMLFESLALGDSANPIVVLDEIDKAARSYTSRDVDTLAQLHSCLEPETSRRITDISLDVELDASLVTYIATANSIAKLDSPLLSRFEVVQVGIPSAGERREAARRVMEVTMKRLGLEERVRVSPGVVVVLESFSPRVIRRTLEKAAGAVLAARRDAITVDDVEIALGLVERARAPVVH